MSHLLVHHGLWAKGPPLCPTCSYTMVYEQRVPPYVPLVRTPWFFLAKVPPYVHLLVHHSLWAKGQSPLMSHLLVPHDFLAKSPPLMFHLLVHHDFLGKGPPLCPTCLFIQHFFRKFRFAPLIEFRTWLVLLIGLSRQYYYDLMYCSELGRARLWRARLVRIVFHNFSHVYM